MPRERLPRPSLTSLNSLTGMMPLLRGVHWTAHRLLIGAGYRWELRRNGELKLGLWRKSWGGARHKRGTKTPRRFVFVPGFGDTPLSWLFVLTLLQPVLRRRFDEVVIVDFPGFAGFLSHEKSFHSMDLLQKAVSDLFDSLKPTVIAGHSLGGWLAAYYVAECGKGARPVPASAEARRPDYRGPERVVLISPPGVFGAQSIREEWEGKFRTVLQEGFHALRPHLFAKEPLWFRWIASEFAQFIARDEIVQFIHSFRDDHMLEGLLPLIQSEVCLVWGDQDSLIPASCASVWLRELKKREATAAQPLREPKVALLKGIGHSPQVEGPLALAAVLGQFLSEREPHALGQRWWQVLGA